MTFVVIHTVKWDKILSCVVQIVFCFLFFWLREVRIDMVPYTLALSQNFNQRLVMPKFQDISLSLCATKTPSFSTRALLSQNYNAHENSLLLRNPDTRNPCSTPGRKESLVQIGGGTFVTYPTFRTSASLSHGSPSHPLLFPIQKPRPPKPLSTSRETPPSIVRPHCRPAGASAPTTSSTATA